MQTNAQRQKMPSQSRSSPAKRPSTTPSTAVPNSVMASMMGVSDRGGYATQDFEETMRSRFFDVRERLQAQIPQAESEADRFSAAVNAGTPASVKAIMGQRMGADFSGVRFHTGAAAAAKADAMGARAYTSGSDVYFGEGGFDASVAAHELVHTVQQGMVDSGVSTMSTPVGGVQMMPKAIEWLWRKTGGKLIRDNHDAMERMYVHEHVLNDMDRVSESTKKKEKFWNPIAHYRYTNNPEVQQQVKARYEKHRQQEADAGDFLAQNRTGKTSRLGSKTDEVDLAVQPEPESLGDKVTDVMDKTGAYAGDPAGEVADLMEHIPTDAAEIVGEHTGEFSDGVGMLSDLNEGGQEAIQMIKALKEGDTDAAKEHGKSAGKSGISLATSIAEKVADSDVSKTVAKQAGQAATVLNVFQNGVDMYEGGKQAFEGAQQRKAMGEITKRLGDRENLEGDDLLERDSAVMGKMKGTRDVIEGTGQATSAALRTGATIADASGAGAPVGIALDAASKVVDVGTKAASNAQTNRMDEKITEQTLGITDEKIRAYMKWYEEKHGKPINYSRAKQALIKSEGFKTGQRREVKEGQTQLRAEAMAQSANAGGRMGLEIAQAGKIEPNKEGKYVAADYNEVMGGSGENAQRDLLRKHDPYAADIADQDAAAAAAAAAAPAPLVPGPGTKTSEETMGYRKHTGQGQRLDFDPTAMSDDESLAMMFDSIKRHEAAGDMDPEQLSHLKREFAQARARQMDAQYKKDNPSPPPAPAKKEPPKKDKKWYQFWK